MRLLWGLPGEGIRNSPSCFVIDSLEIKIKIHDLEVKMKIHAWRATKQHGRYERTNPAVTVTATGAVWNSHLLSESWGAAPLRASTTRSWGRCVGVSWKEVFSFTAQTKAPFLPLEGTPPNPTLFSPCPQTPQTEPASSLSSSFPTPCLNVPLPDLTEAWAVFPSYILPHSP